ncbi:MAG: amino acid ABC transporter substrate-binding protein [Alphaproteobacteria bacterium]|nr:amino acid ABC transporter substrate-binding protein [Alphaproteobacteria bacterium]
MAHVTKAPAAQTTTNNDQPSFERIQQTNTLRCGYIVWPPEFIKDVNTGKFSGISYDVTEAMAKSLNLKVDWVEEVNFVNMVAGLKTGRYDAICFSLYLSNVPLAREIDFTAPFFYTGSGVYARADDHRFDNGLSLINSPDITVATLDGELSQYVRAEDFPLTKNVSLPQPGDTTLLMQAVETGKADVTFVDQFVASPYLKANPGKLRDLATGNPLRFHGHGLAVNKGETKLNTTLSMALKELEYSGQMDKIFKNNGIDTPSVLRTALPYATPK